MNWNSVSEFLSMGGYGLYVWGSYIVTAVVLATELVMLASRRRAVVRELAKLARGDRLNPGRLTDET